MRFFLSFLLISTLLFAIPVKINVRFVVTDNTGKQSAFTGVTFTFRLIGDDSTTFWEEDQILSSESGIISTELGIVNSIDPKTFFNQDSVRVKVLKSGTEVVLFETFNTVPYAFRALFSDSAKTAGISDSAINAQLLGGKSISFFLDTTYSDTLSVVISDSVTAQMSRFRQIVSDSLSQNPGINPTPVIEDSTNALRALFTQEIADSLDTLRSQISKTLSDSQATLVPKYRSEISDSLNSVTLNDPSQQISDSASQLRITIRADISDTGGVLVTKLQGQINDSILVINTRLRAEIADSISAHPGINPSSQISDTAQAMKLTFTTTLNDSLIQFRTVLRGEITDTINAHPPSQEISDTAGTIRAAIRSEIGDSLNNRFAGPVSFGDSLVIPPGGGPIVYNALLANNIPFHMVTIDTTIFLGPGGFLEIDKIPSGYGMDDMISVTGSALVGASWHPMAPYDGINQNVDRGEIRILSGKINVQNESDSLNLHQVRLFMILRAK